MKVAARKKLDSAGPFSTKAKAQELSAMYELSTRIDGPTRELLWDLKTRLNVASLDEVFEIAIQLLDQATTDAGEGLIVGAVERPASESFSDKIVVYEGLLPP